MSKSSVIPFSKKCIQGINRQINAELSAGYVYHALYAYFAGHDVALNNVAAFFLKSYKEEHDHANQLIEYLNKRGATVTFKDIKAPTINKVTLVQSFEVVLELEKDVHKKIKKLHILAQEEEAHFEGFLEEVFLDEQVNAEHQLMIYITKINRLGTGLGEYLFDKSLGETLNNS